MWVIPITLPVKNSDENKEQGNQQTKPKKELHEV